MAALIINLTTAQSVAKTLEAEKMKFSNCFVIQIAEKLLAAMLLENCSCPFQVTIITVVNLQDAGRILEFIESFEKHKTKVFR